MLRNLPTVFAALLLPLFLSCSIPLTVRRVSPQGAADVRDVKGVRYLLKRPVTSVALRPAAGAKVADLQLMGKERCQVEHLATIEKACSNDDASRECRGAKDSENLTRCREGVRNRADEACKKMKAKDPEACAEDWICPPYRLDLVIDQKMKKAWVYEAEFSPDLLADTDVTLELREDGTLSGVSAGEDDRILPFVEAVAGLAISVATATATAGVAVAGQPPPPEGHKCEERAAGPKEAMKKLVDKQIGLLQKERDVKDRLSELRERLRTNSSTDYEKLGKHVLALTSELELIKGEKGKNKHGLSRTEALVCVDKRNLWTRAECAEAATGTLLRIDLETRS